MTQSENSGKGTKMSDTLSRVKESVKRILMYTAEIIASIILLVLVSLPLVFVVPMWIESVVFGTPIGDLAINPVQWFGAHLTFWIEVGLALFSFLLLQAYLVRIDTEEANNE
jgi:energy-converting hydrogenase Eha subunit A